LIVTVCDPQLELNVTLPLALFTVAVNAAGAVPVTFFESGETCI